MSFSKLYKKVKAEYIFLTKGGVAYARSVGVTVGNNCRIMTKRFGNEPFLIEIGNNVTITSNVILLTHDGSTWLFRDEKGRRYTYKRVKIGNNVFIGVNSIIMPGIIIEDNVIVGAGSVVTKSIPQGCIVAGNPARVISRFDVYKESVLKENISDADFIKTITRKENITLFADKATYKPMFKV